MMLFHLLAENAHLLDIDELKSVYCCFLSHRRKLTPKQEVWLSGLIQRAFIRKSCGGFRPTLNLDRRIAAAELDQHNTNIFAFRRSVRRDYKF